MNDKPKPPTIVTAVCSTVVGLCALAGCFFTVKSNGPDFLFLISILANVMLISLAVLQWVVYFRAYVDFRVDQVRQENSSKD